jgi:hypothetical protein
MLCYTAENLCSLLIDIARMEKLAERHEVKKLSRHRTLRLNFSKMKYTLNKLAKIAFSRKARKLGKDVQVIDFTKEGFDTDHFIQKNETLIIWNEEAGFHSVVADKDRKLLWLINFPEKYEGEEVYHFGILNKEKSKLFLYRHHHSYYGLRFEYEESLMEDLLRQEEEFQIASSRLYLKN